IYSDKTKNEVLVAILEVKDATVEEVNTLVSEISKDTNKPADGNTGNNDTNQGGSNSNNTNNSNTNKPSTPQTGDVGILGFIGIGIASIAGVFVNNRRKK
ncbi:MAG: hypothetical protein J6D47_00255, partial [Peptostreptococcaceae bacterium]|nr:hypothetical protein [Peptostreptococcaceae bacterium]